MLRALRSLVTWALTCSRQNLAHIHVGMQLITEMNDTLARRQICLMLHRSCQWSGDAVMHYRFSQPCASAALQHDARMIESSDTLSTGRYGSILCLVGGIWLPSRLPHNCWLGSLGHVYVSQSLMSLVKPNSLAVWLSGSESNWQHLSASAFCSLQKSDLQHVKAYPASHVPVLVLNTPTGIWTYFSVSSVLDSRYLLTCMHSEVRHTLKDPLLPVTSQS